MQHLGVEELVPSLVVCSVFVSASVSLNFSLPACLYWVAPKGWLTFLEVLGRDFRRIHWTLEVTQKKSLWMFLWQPVTFCFEKKNCLYYPPSGDEGSILAWIIVSTSMARPTVAKNQGNQFSQYSDVTNGRLVTSSAYLPRNMTLKSKVKLSEGSWDKILHFKLRNSVFGRKKYFLLAVCFSKIKVPGLVFAPFL